MRGGGERPQHELLDHTRFARHRDQLDRLDQAQRDLIAVELDVAGIRLREPGVDVVRADPR